MNHDMTVTFMNGIITKIRAQKNVIEDFGDTWPCFFPDYPDPEDPPQSLVIDIEFAPNGDLVDIQGDGGYDEAGISAFVSHLFDFARSWLEWNSSPNNHNPTEIPKIGNHQENFSEYCVRSWVDRGYQFEGQEELPED